MSFHLINEQGVCFWFSVVSWHKVIELAELGGWRPAGTEKPGYYDELRYGKWSGKYTTNNRQWVTAQDAAALADALECMIDDLPDTEAPDLKVEYGKKDVGLPSAPRHLKWLLTNLPDGETVVGENCKLSPLAFFGGKYKDQIRDFVTFCRLGSFALW
jgi:hypothetical protein